MQRRTPFASPQPCTAICVLALVVASASGVVVSAQGAQAPLTEEPALRAQVETMLLWQVLTAKRWEVLKVLSGAGPMSIREVARRLGRDVKAVHRDVTALLNAGVLSRTADGSVEFPFQVVKVEFVLQAA